MKSPPLNTSGVCERDDGRNTDIRILTEFISVTERSSKLMRDLLNRLLSEIKARGSKHVNVFIISGSGSKKISEIDTC